MTPHIIKAKIIWISETDDARRPGSKRIMIDDRRFLKKWTTTNPDADDNLDDRDCEQFSAKLGAVGMPDGHPDEF